MRLNITLLARWAARETLKRPRNCTVCSQFSSRYALPVCVNRLADSSTRSIPDLSVRWSIEGTLFSEQILRKSAKKAEREREGVSVSERRAREMLIFWQRREQGWKVCWKFTTSGVKRFKEVRFLEGGGNGESRSELLSRRQGHRIFMAHADRATVVFFFFFRLCYKVTWEFSWSGWIFHGEKGDWEVPDAIWILSFLVKNRLSVAITSSR